MNDDTCLHCGRYAPEGSWVCPICVSEAEKSAQTNHQNINKILTDIAKKELGILYPETRFHDTRDFYELGIWNIKRALKEAYDQGWKDSAQMTSDILMKDINNAKL